MSPEDKPRGFTITDRRSFTDSGDRREEDEDTVETPPPPAEPPAAAAPTPGGRRLPPVDFPTFVLSLGSSALINLGEADPAGGTSKKDLPLAKHTIDILSMLEEKTRGNLSPPEAQLLENLLFDLRLRYVDATKSKT